VVLLYLAACLCSLNLIEKNGLSGLCRLSCNHDM
jgi:hypothetical protein